LGHGAQLDLLEVAADDGYAEDVLGYGETGDIPILSRGRERAACPLHLAGIDTLSCDIDVRSNNDDAWLGRWAVAPTFRCPAGRATHGRAGAAFGADQSSTAGLIAFAGMAFSAAAGLSAGPRSNSNNEGPGTACHRPCQESDNSPARQPARKYSSSIIESSLTHFIAS